MIDSQTVAARADPEFDGRAYALSLTSRRMLEALGLWPALAGRAQAIAEIKISDGRPGEGAAPWFLHFDHDEIDEGPMGHMIEDRYLRVALIEAMAAAPLIEHRARFPALLDADAFTLQA